jgi:hypothetical protein
MMTFLSFHAAAAARGDGLHPELLALLAGVPAASHAEPALRHDGMSRSRPDPKATEVEASCEGHGKPPMPCPPRTETTFPLS